MKVALLGATGFVGRAVALSLRSRDHSVVACARSAERGRRMLGSDIIISEAASGVPDPEILSQCDIVINFAGSPLVGRRWTAKRLDEAEASRVGLTQTLVSAIGRASPRPKALLSTSAVGYYPDLGEGDADETATAGADRLADLCSRWESEAFRAESLGVRVVVMRLGIVLGRFGGMLEVLEPVFRLHLGGKLSSGKQWISWVHIDDLCRAVVRMVESDDLEGAVNVAAPEPVRYGDFARCLAEELGVGARWTIPGPLIKAVLAEGADSLLTGRRAIPKKLIDAGFDFWFRDVADALGDIYRPLPVVVQDDVSARDAFPELQTSQTGNGALIHSVVSVGSSREAVFEFHSRPANLGPLIPPRIPFAVVDAPEKAEDDTVVDYRLGRPPFAKRYRGVIFGIRPNEEFFDRNGEGTWFDWLHRHRFVDLHRGTNEGQSRGTTILDDLWIKTPLQKLSSRAAKSLARLLFEYRAQVLGWRFGRRKEGSALA